jgi:hypothetical protein
LGPDNVPSTTIWTHHIQYCRIDQFFLGRVSASPNYTPSYLHLDENHDRRRNQQHKNNRLTNYAYQRLADNFQQARRYKVDSANDGLAQVYIYS